MRGREAFQELDYRAVFGSMAKWVVEIDDPARIPELVSRAFQIATNSGCRLGAVRYCRMGVMRVIPAYTTSQPDEMGTLDTTALDKEVVAVVEVGYSVR